MEDVSVVCHLALGPDSDLNLVVVGANAGSDIFKVIASIRSAHPELPIIVMSHASGAGGDFEGADAGGEGFSA